MKNLLFNSSPSLRAIGHFNLIIGLLIIFVLFIGQISWADTSGWNSVNKEVEVTSDVVLPSVNTIVNTAGWNSENNSVIAPVTTSTTGYIYSTSTGSGWNSVNKEIQEPYGDGKVIGQNSTSSEVYATTTKIINTPTSVSTQIKIATTTKKIENTVNTSVTIKKDEIPTLKISTINNDLDENNKIYKNLNATTTSAIENEESLSQVPFYTPTVDVGYQIQKTISVVNSLGTTSEKKVEAAYGVKTEDVNLLYKDTNKDGISDYDSIYVYNIDPVKESPITVYGGKKINAGEKVVLGFDPATTSAVKIDHEEPESSTVKEISNYKVNEVALNIDKQIVLKGVALPNSFVTLYIYSTPVIVTVKTDSNGEWQYTLNKELEDGQHVVYTATVNNTGKILAKSAPFAFAKTAEAATLVPTMEKQITDIKPEVWNSKYTIMVVGFLIVSVLAVLFVIGVGIKKSTNQLNEIKEDDLQSKNI
jgi:hypothetical protein